MTDDQIEKLVWDEIRKKKITLSDMIGGEIVNGRRNRFIELFNEHRMKELLCVGEYDPYNNMPLLKVEFQDLFRFWWNRCIDRSFFAEEVLGGIFEYFTEQMKPPVPEPQQMDLTLNLNQLDLTQNEVRRECHETTAQITDTYPGAEGRVVNFARRRTLK